MTEEAGVIPNQHEQDALAKPSAYYPVYEKAFAPWPVSYTHLTLPTILRV